jgi:hypothetical protein
LLQHIDHRTRSSTSFSLEEAGFETGEETAADEEEGFAGVVGFADEGFFVVGEVVLGVVGAHEGYVEFGAGGEGVLSSSVSLRRGGSDLGGVLRLV